VGRGATKSRSVLTVDEWAERHVASQRARLTPKTVALYESLLRSCILPYFSGKPLRSVRKIEVREWVASLCERPLSASRVRQALGLLSQVFDAAVEDGLANTNPCAGVRGPRLRATEPRILTPEEVGRLAAAVRPPYGLLVELLAYAGLRIGECFALRRRSVDLANQRLVISESLSEVSGRHSFGPTKSHQVRAVSLPDFLLDRLEGHLATLSPAAECLLFVGRTGRPLHYNAFRTWTWNPAAESVGLSGVTPHDLRATCASWVAANAGVLEAARRLGHAQTSVTTRHYARPLQGRDRDVAQALSQLRREVPDPQHSE
jgi:integrase